MIDDCWTNCPDKSLENLNISNSAYDHNMVEVTIKIKGKIVSPIKLNKRLMTKLGY